MCRRVKRVGRRAFEQRKMKSSDSSPQGVPPRRQRHRETPPVTSASICAVRGPSFETLPSGALASLKSALRYLAELTLGWKDTCEIDIMFPWQVR